MSTATPETTSPAPAKTPEFALLLNTAGFGAILKLEAISGGRIAECCGSAIYPKDTQWYAPWGGYVCQTPEWDKYRYFDGTKEHARKLIDELSQNTEHHEQYLKKSSRGRTPFDIEYWIPYAARDNPYMTPEQVRATAERNYKNWLDGLANLHNIFIKDVAQVVFDPRPMEEASKWWFESEKWDGLRDGIEIDDPDVGKHCLLWVNA